MRRVTRTCAFLALVIFASTYLLPGRPAQADVSFVVTTNTHDGDSNISDGLCATAAGPCSLRAAIEQANATAGTERVVITFNIAKDAALGYQSTGDYWRITLPSSPRMPPLTRANITIDGTRQVSPGVFVPTIEIDGALLTTSNRFGIVINASGTLVRGLIVNGVQSGGVLDNGPSGFGIIITGFNEASPGSPKDVRNNIVEYCYIGTDYAGSIEKPNARGGVAIVYGADQNIVRNNVISGNGVGSRGPGVYVGSNPGFAADQAPVSNNEIYGNIIGLTANGTAALPNKSHGVELADYSADTIVGPNNVISGNGSDIGAADFGVSVEVSTESPPTSGHIIKNNAIGTNRTGQGAVRNLNGGIFVGKASNITISGNQIAGHSGTGFDTIAGIFVDNRLSVAGIGNITIRDNIIGLNATATTALPNFYGVVIECGASQVTVGPGNVISGNTLDGVRLTDECSFINSSKTVTNNRVIGNLIGINGSGTALPNEHGVSLIDDSVDPDGPASVQANTVGGTASGEGNLISSNKSNGIRIVGVGATGNQVRNNRVAANGSDGVLVDRGTGNQILGTTTTANGGTNQNLFGIQLANGGNREGQSDRPSLTLASVNAGNPPTISGSVSNCSSGCTVEVFSSANGEAHEGPFFVSSFATSASFNNQPIPDCKPYLIFTITDNAGNTSEFTNPPNGPYSDICVLPTYGVSLTTDTPTGSPTPSPGSASYQLTLRNAGNTRDTILLGDTSSVAGMTVTYPAGQSFTLDAGQSTQIAVVVNIPAGLTQSQVSTTITATSQGDTTKKSSATLTTPLIKDEPVPQLTPSTASGAGKPGTQVVYTHELKNIGPTSGSFTLSASGLPAGWGSTVTPTTVTLAANATTSVILTVSIPPGVAADTQATATLTASAIGGTATARDTTTVLPAPALTLTPLPPQDQQAGPGQVIEYRYALRNDGNGTDRFTIALAAPTTPSSWTTAVFPGTSVTLPRDESTTLVVRLVVPEATTPGTYNTTVTVTSSTDTTVNASGLNVTTIVDAAVPRINFVPGQNVDPGSSATFEHTITNVGNIDGTFTLELQNVPAGWSVTPPVASVTLTSGASTTVQFTLTPPGSPSPALAGLYEITLKATATDANAATAQVIDELTVNEIADLALTPPSSSPGDPGTVVTYTFRLENNGNFTDTVSLNLLASQGWTVVSDPAEVVVLAAGAERLINVGVTVPPGIPFDTQNTTTLTVLSSKAGEEESASVVTTVAAVPGVTLSPATLTLSGIITETVPFTFTLFNSGSIIQSYTVTTTTGPQNWIVSLAPTTFTDLAPGETRSVELVLQAPEGTPNGTTEFTLQATSTTSPGVSDTAIARLRIGPAIDLAFAPDRSGAQLPGTIVRYTHQITNTGRISETFNLSSISALGWETSISPVSVFLEPDATTPVTVTVVVPPSAAAQLQSGGKIVDTVTATARAASEPDIMAQVFDRTTVLQFARVSFAPGYTELLVPGSEIIFRHTLFNTGNGFDAFTISMTQDLNWPITIVPLETPTLRRAQSFAVEVRVTIPANATLIELNRIRVRATSQFDPAVYEELVNVISQNIIRTEPVRMVYLPLVQRGGGR